MKSTVKIADIVIALEADNINRTNKKMRVFETKEQAAGMSISYRKEKDLELPADYISFDETMKWSKGDREETANRLYVYDNNIGKVVHQVFASSDWKEVKVTSNIKERKPANTFLNSIGEVAFRNRILFHDGLVIHGSAIACENKGIIFSGPSGTGKSTQSGLWRKYKKAELINDDRPAIRVIDGSSYVFGTMWNGSSKKYTNRSAPLAAIVLLQQNKENIIERLSADEAVKRLMPRSFLPYNNEENMGRALKNLEKIVSVTPVYLLKCRPDREAVELLCQCLN